MKPISGRILVVLLALTVGIALGAGLAGALRTPAPPIVDPVELDSERTDETGEGKAKRNPGKNDRGEGKNAPPPGDGPPPRSEAPTEGGVPPPAPPAPPTNSDDDGDSGDDSDDGTSDG